MTKKHFQAAAELVKFLDVSPAEKMLVAQSMVELFRQFNGRFDQGRFLQACGLSDLG